MLRLKVFFILLSLVLFVSCGTGDSSDAPDDGSSSGNSNSFDNTAKGLSSFQLIQTRIFDTSCIVCHSPESKYYSGHGLDLSKGKSYEALVGADVKSNLAQKTKIKRVDPKKPDQSLLYQKALIDSPYGNTMPLGKEALFKGQLEFIKKWIEAGAPKEGNVADPKLLDDKTPQKKVEFKPIAPPKSGFQMTTGKFEILPGQEREFFQYKQIGNKETIYVKKFEVQMRPGSHHFILYDLYGGTPKSLIPNYDEVRDLRNEKGVYNFKNLQIMQYHRFLIVTQVPFMDYVFPKDVALEFKAGHAVDLNTQYVNYGKHPTYGQVYLNLHTVKKEEVKHKAKMLFFLNAKINLPAKQKTTIKNTYKFGGTRKIIMLVSHFHKFGEKYIVRISSSDPQRNGKEVYVNTSWDNPLIKPFDPPLILKRGEGLTTEVTWNNTSDKKVNFGLLSSDEMDIIGGYYY